MGRGTLGAVCSLWLEGAGGWGLTLAARGLWLGVGTGPAWAQQVDVDRLSAELEPAIHAMMTDGQVSSATIALVVGDETIWSQGYGYANIWAKTPAVPETVYLIGSTFKAMSTMALLRQMEQGDFELDDAVTNYMDELVVRSEHPGDPVRFRLLPPHTSTPPGLSCPSLGWRRPGPHPTPPPKLSPPDRQRLHLPLPSTAAHPHLRRGPAPDHGIRQSSYPALSRPSST